MTGARRELRANARIVAPAAFDRSTTAVLLLLLALVVMPANYPGAVCKPLTLIADSLLQMVALASGMQMRLVLPRHHYAPRAYGLLAKSVLMPLLVPGLCALLGLSGERRGAAIYETTMPSMITAGALLSLAGLAPELAAAMVGYGITLSMVTSPAWHWLLSAIG